MKFLFEYKDVLTRCVILSSYEGRDYVGDSGDSMYLTVKITQQDVPLLKTYISDAVHKLEDMLQRMVISSIYKEDSLEWELRTDETRWNLRKKFTDNFQEAVVGYAMFNWLNGRKADSVATYQAIWQDMSAMCVRNLFAKIPPKKFKQRKEDICDVEVSVEDTTL
jgi:hypothetical protein